MTEKKFMEKPTSAGKSSFDKVDTKKLFKTLGLKPEATFIDVGSGNGRYTFKAAEIIGSAGLIYAMDAWEDGIKFIKEEAERKGFNNIHAFVGDVGDVLPIEDNVIDTCFICALLHEIIKNEKYKFTISEARRILKYDGQLAIVEWKKIEEPFGASYANRFSADELKQLIEPFGFRVDKTVDVGPRFYVQTYIPI